MSTAADAGETTVLVIRTCNADMTSHDGFKWPESGPVSAPDWGPKPACGQGLHGLLDGVGDYALVSRKPDAKWLIVSVPRAEVVDLDGKVKFPRGEVVYCGGMAGALTRIAQRWITIAQAGAKGQHASGRNEHAAATGDYGHAAATGYYGHAAATGYSGHAAATGDAGAAAVLGLEGRAKAGTDGLIAVAWHDGKRPRLAVGYVGENGIKADTWYRATKAGKLVKAAK